MAACRVCGKEENPLCRQGAQRDHNAGCHLLRTQEYTIADLEQRLQDGRGVEGNPTPITKHRILSQVQNPRAASTDVALLVAYDGDTVVGHLGVLPDLAFVGAQEHKIGWLTAWWANPDRKYAGVGLMLLMRAQALYGGAVGASGFSDDAKKIYSATRKFVTVKELAGITVMARFNLRERLISRAPWLEKVRWMIGVVDCAANQCIRLVQLLWRQFHQMPEGFRVEYLPQLDEEAQAYIARHQGAELTRRGALELNWIHRNPWILSAPLGQPSSFHFSSAARSYGSFIVKVLDLNDRIAAVLMLIVVDGQLTVPYCYHDDGGRLVAQLLCDHVIALRLERVTTYRAELIETLAAIRFPWIWTKRKARSWVLSSSVGHAEWSGCSLQDGDGDCVFTP